MPYYLAIGVPCELFMHLNPTKCKPFEKAYKIELEQQDSMLHRQGVYVRDALLCTVGNMFSGKLGQKLEYPKKPYGFNGGELSKKEIELQRRLLLAQLQAMKTNHDMMKKEKNGKVS